MDSHILSIVLFTPLAGMIPLMFLPKENKTLIKVWANVVMVIGFLVSLPLWWRLDRSNADFQLVERANWIPSIGAQYHIGIDGISLLMVLLTTVIGLISVFSSWSAIEDRLKEYYCFFLLLQTGMLGVFMSLDFFLFYVFWEVMLVPMYFIIGVWGGPRKLYAAIKFFLYTLFGSVLMLLGILTLYFHHYNQFGTYTFDILALMKMTVPLYIQKWVFWGFFLGFAIKVPMFPFHTWLPDAHVEAPTGGSVILAGILLKLGTYGFLRFALPLFPHAAKQAQPLLVALALIGIIYGALVAWVQVDMKKLVAYSSIAHLGFVMLGILAFQKLAWQGALLQMVNHGLSTGALFLLVGMLYDRRHTKKFEEFGGLAKVMPIFAFFLVFSSLASVGLPALNGFVGEFLILAGSYKILPWQTAVATSGVILAALYLLKMVQLTVWGPLTKDENRSLKDLGLREIAALVPLAIFMLWIGLAPAKFIAPTARALDETLAAFEERLAEPAPAQPGLRLIRGSMAAAQPAEAGR